MKKSLKYTNKVLKMLHKVWKLIACLESKYKEIVVLTQLITNNLSLFWSLEGERETKTPRKNKRLLDRMANYYNVIKLR